MVLCRLHTEESVIGVFTSTPMFSKYAKHHIVNMLCVDSIIANKYLFPVTRTREKENIAEKLPRTLTFREPLSFETVVSYVSRWIRDSVETVAPLRSFIFNFPTRH